MFNGKGERYTLKRHGNSQKGRRKTRGLISQSSTHEVKVLSPVKNQVRINWKIPFGFDKKRNTRRPELGNAKDQSVQNNLEKERTFTT